MNLKVEYGIIAILLLASLYYFYKHQSLLSDLSRVQEDGNPELKVVKGKHSLYPAKSGWPGIGGEFQSKFPDDPKCEATGEDRVYSCDLTDTKTARDQYCRQYQHADTYCSDLSVIESRGIKWGACCSSEPNKHPYNAYGDHAGTMR